MSCPTCDLLVIGGGPAGLSAAINGASEGLSVRMIDAGAMLGGQARESAAIENYPGFPEAITGNELMSRFVRQSTKFLTKHICPTTVAKLRLETTNGRSLFTATTDDYQEFSARCVLLSIGLSYRRLAAEGMGPLMGRGVYYGMPPVPLSKTKATNVAIVGGANSAGQAVVRAASYPAARVKLLVRKKLTDQMSTYLIDQIKKLPNVEVCEGCEVVAVYGAKSLEYIGIRYADGTVKNEACDMLSIFIGATPKTLWLDGLVELDDKKYVVTAGTARGVLPFETSLSGVFAAGDVRAGSTKRIASAIGEGAGALQMIHRALAR